MGREKPSDLPTSFNSRFASAADLIAVTDDLETPHARN
jgi:hypothetical protein